MPATKRVLSFYTILSNLIDVDAEQVAYPMAGACRSSVAGRALENNSDVNLIVHGNQVYLIFIC
jgi:hypothetical protein